MKRVIIGVPGLFDAGFEPKGEAWTSVIERSRIFGVRESTGSELAWLGLPPEGDSIAQGPLAAAAYGIWPPDRSVVYQVTIMGIDPDGPTGSVALSPQESNSFFDRLLQLNRRGWTFARGEGDTHVLVRERGSIDAAVRPPWELVEWEPEWPDGDDSETLRQIILDSREVFEHAEENQVRRGEGRPIVAFAWMWGPGLAASLPNLAVMRGEPVRFESSWLRLKGAARLAGYGHGSMTSTFVERLREAAKALEPVVIVEPIVDEEGAERFGSVLQEFVFEPLVLHRTARDLRLTILDPNGLGLGLNFDARRDSGNGLPFDRRVLDDSRLKTWPLHEAMMRSLAF